MKENNCLKSLGLLNMNSECFGCDAARKVKADCQQKNVVMKEDLQQKALEMSKVCCPNGAVMVLPRGSSRLW